MLARLPSSAVPGGACSQRPTFPLLLEERSRCVAWGSRAVRRVRGQQPPPQAFFGDLLQRLDPSSWAEGSPALAGRERRRAQARRALFSTLELCRQEPEVRLPSGEEAVPAHMVIGSSSLQSVEQQEAMVSAALHADPSCAASNAVPFSPVAISEGHQKDCSSGGPFGGGCGNGGPGVAPRAETVRPVLPCVFAAEGKLDVRGAEHLASQLALRQMHQLDFARFREGQARCLPEDVYWCGPAPFPSARVAAAATLHRMIARLGGLAKPLPEVSGSVVVMTFSPQDRQLAAAAFALYLFLYCRLDLEEAAKEAQLSLQALVQPSSLLPCLEELAVAAEGWQRRVMLVWPYGGGRVEVSGEAVGGWERKVPMSFDVRRRLWVIWLWGLPPGTYRCKFIVDGRWCIDMAAPTELDSRGNVNNVIVVPAVPPKPEPGCFPGPVNASSSGSPVGGSSDDEEQGDVRGAGAATGAGVGEGLGPAAAEAPPSDGEEDSEGEEVEEGGSTAGGRAPPPGLRAHDGDVVRFGAMLLAFYTKLAVQRRVPVYH